MVDDEEMSSQGSVNAPVARPASLVVQGPTYQAPSGLPPWPVLPKESILAEAAPTQQSIFTGPLCGSAATTIPVQSTEVLATPTVPVDSPTRAETQQAFAEVSSALRGVSSQHEEVRSGMQELASGVEALRRARASDVETTAQVQATLQRTISASSSMEYRLEQTAEEQRKAREAAEEAKRASAMALERAAQLQKEQEKTSQQIEQTVTAQAMEAQRTIEGATQVAVQTQREVRGLSETARKAEYTAQITASKVEQQAEDIARQVKEQREQAMKEARAIQIAQEKMAQQLEEAQKAVQSTVNLSQYYEKQLDAVTSKMAKMEKLLTTQTQRSTTLEGQLSAAQDRIGGAERRAKLLEDENVRINSELQYWNDLYSQETGVTPPQTGQEVNSPPSGVVSAAPTIPPSVSSLIIGYENVASGSGPTSAAMSIPQSTSVLSSPSMIFGNTGMFNPAGNVSSNVTESNVNPNGGFGSWDIPPLIRQQSGRRESFGSVFPGSEGNGGNGDGRRESVGTTAETRRARATQPATFNIGIKPKEPPVFNGRANEDIDTWLAKVGDFIYLTEANERQQVAYMATLLQEAAADWWTALLKERHGARPADYLEMSALLQKRFGSTTRVDRARAALEEHQAGTIRISPLVFDEI